VYGTDIPNQTIFDLSTPYIHLTHDELEEIIEEVEEEEDEDDEEIEEEIKNNNENGTKLQ
jgi:hypothetical protein